MVQYEVKGENKAMGYELMPLYVVRGSSGRFIDFTNEEPKECLLFASHAMYSKNVIDYYQNLIREKGWKVYKFEPVEVEV